MKLKHGLNIGVIVEGKELNLYVIQIGEVKMKQNKDKMQWFMNFVYNRAWKITLLCGIITIGCLILWNIMGWEI